MKIKTFLSLLLFFAVTKSQGQTNYRKVFSSAYPANFYNETAALSTSDNGIIFCQRATDSLPSTGNGFSIIKIDYIGNVQWSSFFAVNDSLSSISETPEDIVELSDGSFLILSHFAVGASYIHLIHIDSIGNLLSVKELNQSGNSSTGYSMILDSDGNLLISGYNSFNVRGLYLKVTPQGNVLWAKSYKTPFSNGTFVNGQCFVNNIIKTQDNGNFMAGRIMDTLITSSSFHLQILKSDSVGNVLWSRTVLDSTSNGSGNPGKCIQTNSGDFIVLGQYFTINSNLGYQTILKLDSIGNIKWYKGIKNVFVTGVKELNGNYIIGGIYYNPASNGKIGISSIDTSGNPIPYLQFQGNTFNTLLLFDSTTNTISSSSMIMNQNNNTLFYNIYHQQSSGNYFPEILKTDSLFNTDCYTQGISVEDTILPFNIDTGFVSSNYSYITNDITFIYNAHTMNINATDHCLPLSVNSIKPSNLGLSVYPNPTTGDFTLEFSKIVRNGTVEIFNVYGAKVFEDFILTDKKKVIKLKNVSSGIYYIQVNNGERVYGEKLVIEND